MSRIYTFLSLLAVLAFTVSLSGCGSQSGKPDAKPAKQKSPAKTQTDHDHDHGDHGHADHDHGDHAHAEENSEIAKALSKLSPVDRAAAEKQKTCPVSGGPLGAMGMPIKLTVKGREVFLCCQGCEDAIKKDPDKYLAKLK